MTEPITGGVVTPQLDGEASAAELRELLRDYGLGAASAAQSAADAAQAAQAAASTPTTLTAARHYSTLPVGLTGGSATVFELRANTSAGLLIERIALSWGPVAPAWGDQLIAFVHIGPPGTNPTTDTGMPIVAALGVDPLSLSGLAAGGVIDPSSPIFVPPGQALLVSCIPSPTSTGVQWVEVPAP